MIGKMKDETVGVDIKWFVGLKSKMYSFLIDDGSKYIKAKAVNKNVAAKISHDEYKYVLPNKKCLRHSINRIQSKDNRIGTHEINKISSSCFSCFDDEIYIQNNEYNRSEYCFNFQCNQSSFFCFFLF